jgi:hypothetical protein
MAVITPTTEVTTGYRAMQRTYGTGGAASSDTLTTPTAGRRKLKYVMCAYSGAPTQAGVTVTIDSGLGAGYDCVLTTGSANARYTVYVPAEDVVWLMDGDAIVVAAPSGGGALTAAIVIVTEPA